MGRGLIGVDLGSGGCKVAIIDSKGRLCGRAYKEWPTYYPHLGWSEQNPSDWEEILGVTLRTAISNAKMAPEEMVVLCLSSATHSIVLLDEQDRILRPAILWTDTRTVEQVEWLRLNHGDLIFQESLHAPAVNWSLPYLVWVREKEPWIWERINRIVMPKDYIRLRLTGIWATDPIDSVGTLMFNPIKREWSGKICNAVGIPLEILPPVLLPEQTVGGLTEIGAKMLGLKEGTPVIVGTTDQASEALAAGAVRPGQGIVKLATAGNVAIVTKKPHPDPLRVYAYLHIVPGQWYTLTGTPSCAVCYRWLRDSFFQNLTPIKGEELLSIYGQMDSMAAKVCVGSEGLLFHPNLQGSFTNAHMKGDFVGVTFRHRGAHFCRSVMEGVAFSLYEALLREESIGVRAENFRIIGGGSKSSLWRKIICDVFGREMIVPMMDDSSFGIAMVGGIAIGIFSDVEDAVKKCVRHKETIIPDAENHKIYQELFKCYEEIAESLRPNYEKLAKIKFPIPILPLLSVDMV